MLKVVVAMPGEMPKVQEIDGSLESMQALVGGYVELVHVRELPGLDVYVNEDGRSKKLAPNRIVGGHRIVGPILVSASKGEDMTTMSEQQIALAIQVLA